MLTSPHGINFGSNRPVVMGRSGMVCAGHPLASQAGISTLQRGGNAVDAAIAVAAALNVVEPMMSGIGGDGMIMVYSKEDDRIYFCNGTGAAPLHSHRDLFLRDGIPFKGLMSVSVPALLHSWADAHDRFGQLPFAKVLAPAIDLAANGFPVSHYLSREIAQDQLLCQFPTSQAVFAPGGVPLRPGQILRQENLARTLSTIASEGRDAFYRGSIAEAITRFASEQGGLLSMEDLANCSSRWQDPISTTYRDHTVYEGPPNSSGHVLLQELNLIEQFDLGQAGCNSAAAVHLMVEAKKLAFLDREAYMADPDYVDVPIDGLLSKEYARERGRLIDPARAASELTAGDPWAHQDRPHSEATAMRSGGAIDGEDTTCFVVVDGQGNAVCQLQSIQSGWGSSIIAGDTGVLLNNRMTYWHLDKDHVNCLQPGKRVRHTMNPVMVFGPGAGSLGQDAQRLELVLGTPGADTQVQSNLQVLSHILDFGMTVAEAVEAPRWKDNQSPLESTIPHTCEDELLMEARFADDVGADLTVMGHQVRNIGPWDGLTGREMVIAIDEDSGALQGAADPRADGYAIGY